MGDFYFNYSFVSDELVSEYGENALADSDYQPISSDMAREIIDGLRSHNWHSQNPAISKITPANLEALKKDDLFVLGRNIYQAACGTAHSAVTYLENLQTRLVALDNKINFHILNGILFEIYFDSEGRFRGDPKSNELDSVFRIEESEHFQESFKFIGQALRPYLKNLFYVPSTARGLSVDVSCIEFEDDLKAVNGIYFEGDNVMYDNSGENYFHPSNDQYLRKMSRSKIKDCVSKAMVIPSYRLKLNFLDIDDDLEELLVPYGLNIMRFSN